MIHRNRVPFPAHPAVAVVVHGAEGVAAFAHDDALDLELLRALEVTALEPAHHLEVAGEHAHVRVVPAGLGGHGPVHAGGVEDGRGLIDELGAEFRLGRDDRVVDFRAFLIQRDAQVGELVAGLVLLPLQGVDPLVVLHPHLVECGGVGVRGVLDVLRRDAELVADAPHHAHDEAGVDADGTVVHAALAQVAFGVGQLGDAVERPGIDAAAGFEQHAHGLGDLGGGGVAGVVRVREREVAALGAHAAAHAGLAIGLEPRAGLAGHDGARDLFDFLRREPGNPAPKPHVLDESVLDAHVLIPPWGLTSRARGGRRRTPNPCRRG